MAAGQVLSKVLLNGADGIAEPDADAGALTETDVPLIEAVGTADADVRLVKGAETALPFDGALANPEEIPDGEELIIEVNKPLLPDIPAVALAENSGTAELTMLVIERAGKVETEVVGKVDTVAESGKPPFLGVAVSPPNGGIVKDPVEEVGVKIPAELATPLPPDGESVEFTTDGKMMGDVGKVELTRADGVIEAEANGEAAIVDTIVATGMTVIVTVFSPLVTVLNSVAKTLSTPLRVLV